MATHHKNRQRMHTELLSEFKEHLAVLNRTAATIGDYSAHVRLFLSALTKEITAVTRTDLEAYSAGLHAHRDEAGRPYATNTIILKVRSLKRFFEFLTARNIVFINPMEFIAEPRKERQLPRNVLDESEMRQILDQPNLGTLTGIRDRTILELFYSTGIRLNELCRLTIFDADLQGGMLRINQGKGRKDRVVPLGKHAARFLREYITKVRPTHTRNNRQNRGLLVDRYEKAVSSQAITILIRKYAKAAGITKKVTAHTFRHSFATALVRNGADIVAVRKMLGHADLKTTQGYVRALGLDVKKVHGLSHPREKDKIGKAETKPEIKRMRPEYARKRSLPPGR